MAFPTQSVLLNGSSQYFTRAKTGSTNLYVTSDFTWESWVKFTALPGSGNVMSFYVQSWAAGGNLSFNLQIDNTAGIYSLRARGGSSGNQDFNVLVATNITVATGTWYHYAFVYTASTHTIEGFIDGGSVGSVSLTVTTSIFDGTDPVVVAAEGDASNKYSGRYVLMRFWSTTRTGTQLNASKCTTLGATANLGAEWTFDNTTNDNSGNSNTLTAVGTPTYAADVPAVCAVVGPANLKSFDGNVKSNMKSFDGNLIANIKSIDGNS